MAYTDFTLKEIKDRFGIRIKEGLSLFSNIRQCEVSDLLIETLRNGIPPARGSGTEKARSEFIIAPVLIEVRKILENKISLFSGISFDVNRKYGFSGVCDFLISPSEQQLELTMPVLTVVAAKDGNINAGIPRCMAQMIASRILNEREGNGIKYIFGCVTTGTVWKFLKYDKKSIVVDADDYYIREINKILGIFLEIMSIFIFRLTVLPKYAMINGQRYSFQHLQKVLMNHEQEKI